MFLSFYLIISKLQFWNFEKVFNFWQVNISMYDGVQIFEKYTKYRMFVTIIIYYDSVPMEALRQS